MHMILIGVRGDRLLSDVVVYNMMQFQVEVFSTKKYDCHCTKCGNRFTQNVQKGVDNGCVRSAKAHDADELIDARYTCANRIATKLLTLTMMNVRPTQHGFVHVSGERYNTDVIIYLVLV